MKTTTRTVALVTGAVVMLVGPVVAVRAWSGQQDRRISVGAQAPATLIPGDVRDPTGRMIAGAVWTGLVSYDPRTGAAIGAAAESITSDDRRVWTVRLRAGGRFHDGSAVTADSFAGAWTAVLREGWHGARLFTEVARVKGAARAAETGRVEGLATIDDRTLRVTLDRPLTGFPSLLGDPAFLPLPDGVLRSRDWRSYDRLPIGNGPYRVRAHDSRETTLVRVGAKQEDRPIVVKAMDAARQYAAAQAGDLDVATRVPAERHGSMETDFRSRHVVVAGREMTYLAFPLRDERFASVTLRQALSMAVDRSAVADKALGQQASPATSLVPAGITLGRRDGQCRMCVHDPAAAAAALADAGGLTGPVTLWSDAADGPAARAVAQQLRDALKLDVRLQALPTAEYRKALADERVDGPFIVHSAAGYPSPVAALAPLMRVPTGYRAADPAGLIADAEKAATPEEGVVPARLAESSLLRDLPVTPLWYGHDHLVWSERIRGVTADAFGGLRLDRLTIPADE
ncbi:ABC transporter substrate-binding protein [Actinomadura sp. HBU206391]|uniref:peptide ABC transporter substrate-binding protein n=1 Tax=Actinomadura sp. HBU206391 TaxID=2731692 RepID=UPI001650B1AB|nr:ABC transporter substrate-binding protein [Actinomadura sp. HBU206391]MBC6462521.1 ABC transporter substrate-binding protein [Actinomadura sp. HBU206391]